MKTKTKNETMLSEYTLQRMEQTFVLMVALENGKFEYYVTEPKIFYDHYDEAKLVLDALIQKKELTKEQIKIQTLWKAKP